MFAYCCRLVKILPFDVLKEILEKIVSLSPASEVKNLETNLKDNESDINNTTPCVSSVTVSTIREDPDRFLEINGVKMYFDDEPDVDYDSRRYISKTFDVSNNNTSKSDNPDVNLDVDLPPEIDYSLIDDDYLPY